MKINLLPAQMRVRVWITIHLCSKELVDVSKMVKKISRKNTWHGQSKNSLSYTVITKYYLSCSMSQSGQIISTSVPQSASSGELWSGIARLRRWLVRAQTPQARRRRRFWTGLRTDTAWWHSQTSHGCETLVQHPVELRAAAAGRRS